MTPAPGKLGRLSITKAPDVGELTHYATAPLPPPPAQVAVPDLTWPVALNDQIGDCTIAGVVHADEDWSAQTQEPWTYPGDEAVRRTYFGLTGGADTGLAEPDVLTAWQRDGLLGHRIDAWAPINVRRIDTLRQAVAFYGLAYTGVLLSSASMSQFPGTWELTGTAADGDIVGGHCVPIVAYSRDRLYVVTWGAVQAVTLRWWATYAEEAYAVLGGEYVARGGDAHGIDIAALRADLDAM